MQTQRTFLILVGAVLGIFILMLFFFSNTSANNQNPENPVLDGKTQIAGGYQEVYIKALSTGQYDKPQITVKKGIHVRLHFSAEKGAGCGSAFVMRDFGIQLVSKNGSEQIATFTPQKSGTFEYSCMMRMFIGKMTVV